MRIAYISDADIPSSSANSVHVMKMASAIGSLGHEIVVYLPVMAEGSPGDRSVFRDYGVRETFRLRYLPGPKRRYRYGAYYALAPVLCRLLPYDVIYTRSVRVARSASRLGRDVIFEAHGTVNSPRTRRCARLICDDPRVRRFVFISQRLEELWKREFPVPSGRSMVEHDAIDLERLGEPLDRFDARRTLGLSPTQRVVAYSGHLYRGRGIEQILEMAKSLPDTIFLVVGGRPIDVEAFREESRTSVPNVRLIGHVRNTDVPRYLFAADVLVMPYTAECVTSDGTTRTIEFASPMKMFEYMACVRPIVASNFPGIAEVLRHGSNALLVPPGDTESLLAATVRLLDDPDLSAQLAAQARADVSEHTWMRRAARVLATVS